MTDFRLCCSSLPETTKAKGSNSSLVHLHGRAKIHPLLPFPPAIGSTWKQREVKSLMQKTWKAVDQEAGSVEGSLGRKKSGDTLITGIGLPVLLHRTIIASMYGGGLTGTMEMQSTMVATTKQAIGTGESHTGVRIVMPTILEAILLDHKAEVTQQIASGLEMTEGGAAMEDLRTVSSIVALHPKDDTPSTVRRTPWTCSSRQDLARALQLLQRPWETYSSPSQEQCT